MNCEFCKRDLKLTEHHLIPKTLHDNKWFKKNFSNEQLDEFIELCRDCHDAIHQFIEEKDMGRNYNTKEKLLNHEKVANFVKWISNKNRQFSNANKV